MLLELAPTLPFHPTTFLERGVSVSFTTPALAGTRVRPGQRAGLELIVPNPSGGRGQYILPWSALQDLCRPTLYDRSLQKAVALLTGVTPAAIRRVTREVSAEGHAGRDVKNATRAAVARDRDDLVVTNYYLLLALVRDVLLSKHDYGPPTAASAAAVESEVNLAVARIGPRLGLDANGVGQALEDLANLFVGVGLGPTGMAGARLPQTVARAEALQNDMERWIAECGDDSENAAAAVRACATLTLACATATLADAREMAAHPADLLVRWCDDPEVTGAKIARSEWILDGWDTICAMWETAATHADRRGAISEMAHFAPIIPREVSKWVGTSDAETEAASLFRRLVDLNHDWRSGSHVPQGTERSEHLLAMASCSPMP